MRIIRGKYRSKRIIAPKNINARPTTDFAKEGLFNTLENIYSFEGLEILDLFAGIGSISLEFASRGAKSIDAIDNAYPNVKFIQNISDELKLPIRAYKNDAFKLLENHHKQYDIIFADPPYAMEGIERIPEMVFNSNILKQHGTLIVEHDKKIKLDNHPFYIKTKKYGKVNFSFFEYPEE